MTIKDTTVAVIIPTRNRCESLRQCLERLYPYVEAHSDCTVIVCDDGIADRTKAALGQQFKRVRFIQGPMRGPAANRNAGAAHSVGDLLIFLDDDCRPDPHIIEAYRKAASDFAECGVFEGRTTAEGTWSSFADSAPANEGGGYLWSCNFAIRRELFLRLGGFDERFPFPMMEDVEMRYRVKALSSIRFLWDARAFHSIERRSGWTLVKHHALSRILFCHLHGLKETGHSPWDLMLNLARDLKRACVQYVRREITDDVGHVLLSTWSSILVLVVAVFWKAHRPLTRALFPACCTGCRSIHKSLMSSESVGCLDWTCPQK